MGDFQNHILKYSEKGAKLNLDFFHIWASATKGFERPRIFRYGLPKDIFSRGQKTKGGDEGALTLFIT